MSISYHRPGSMNYSSRSHGSLPNRSSLYRANSGFLTRGSFRDVSSYPLYFDAFLSLPLPSLEIDPKLHQIRTEEKEQIKGLNNQLASFIDKVRKLEQQNKVLETQLKLEDKDQYKSNVRHIMTVHSQPLKQQIETLNQDKDLDDIYLQKVDVESKLESITNEIKYLKQLFEEEIRELESQIQNAMVTVAMDNNRELEMKHIIDEVKEQYKTMTTKSRDEAEQWYKSKIDDIVRQNQKHKDEMKNIKGQIAELTRDAQHINGEIEALKNQRANLENAVASAEEQGSRLCKVPRVLPKTWREALKQAKLDMATKTKEYLDLMHLKLAFDIEIATYRKLLEGEEYRMVGQVPTQQASAINKLAGLLTQGTALPLTLGLQGLGHHQQLTEEAFDDQDH